MDNNAIKKYAVWARRELISRVSQKAMQFGIAQKNIVDATADSVNGHLLLPAEKRQRQALIAKIKNEDYEQVMEEVAYTWFNRFIALRFMEVNGYLPSRVRVFTDENNSFNPQILTEAIHLEMDGLNMDKVYAFKDANQTDELYKYLIITQCNALNSILPGMFQRIEDYTELLFPDNILREGSAIEQMISQITEDDWKDAVQIIGWLYQYYNTEPKDKVFADLKKNIKISKENIPAATQLFTPDWIVRYMVENSLGRLWLESHPNAVLKTNWKYYLDEAEQTPEVAERLRILRAHSPVKSPEDIRLIDPCMGSGHILVYAFDVLMQIYESEGYNPRDAAELILEKNLYGLDIDRRAYQLAYFSLMMKARQYNRRIFNEGAAPQVYYPNGNAELEEFGSLLKVDKPTPKPEFSELISLFEPGYEEKMHVWNYRRLLSDKYDVVVTNPPYMGNMPVKMTEYVIKEYPDSRYDMYSVFIERCTELANKNGFVAMITQHTWMFISSFDRLRTKLLHYNWVNLTHLGTRAFEAIGGEVVQTVSFVFKKNVTEKYMSKGVRLVDYDNAEAKEQAFINGNDVFVFEADNFEKLPGTPYVYWLSDQFYTPFDTARTIEWYVDKKAGVVTGNDPYFVRLWFEPCFTDVSLIGRKDYVKYHVMQKGGGFRRYYGNNEYVIRLADLYVPAKTNVSVRRGDAYYYFKKAIGWSQVGNSQKSFRLVSDSVCGTATPTVYLKSERYYEYILAFLNSKIAFEYLTAYNPTINLLTTDICNIPLLVADEVIEKVKMLTVENITSARTDWDAFETSWDFKDHPLICGERTVAAAFSKWEREATERFVTLKSNEEELNRIFIYIYGLQDELKPEVDDKDVTVRTADLKREIRSLISYAVGCMFGRYSLYNDGLLYAGGPGGDMGSLVEKIQDSLKSQGLSRFPDNEFYPDADNIIPICDDEYFDDDIVGRFVKFIEAVYGKETLDENLRFISDALGGIGSPKDAIRSYFLNDFYSDHLKIYQKRPIYWLFDSGKSNGFKALTYMHRYQPDTIARMRTDYVHEQQARYRTALIDLEQRIAGASTSERVKFNKQLAKLQEQEVEIREYEEKIHHLADQMIRIDPDDGVKHNYEIFEDVLAPIK